MLAHTLRRFNNVGEPVNSLGQFEKPYKVRRSPCFWIAFDVVFEEDTVIAWATTRSNAKSLAAALNGAYNLGRSCELLKQSLGNTDG